MKQVFRIKYCVASVDTVGGSPHVTFYAFREGGYGLHRVSDWNDPYVQWYDTQEEAMKARWNPNDCVLARGFETEQSARAYIVEWTDQEGNLKQRKFERLEDAKLEAASLEAKFDYVAVIAEMEV